MKGVSVIKLKHLSLRVFFTAPLKSIISTSQQILMKPLLSSPSLSHPAGSKCPLHIDCAKEGRQFCKPGSSQCGPCLPALEENEEGRCVARKRHHQHGMKFKKNPFHIHSLNVLSLHTSSAHLITFQLKQCFQVRFGLLTTFSYIHKIQNIRE